MGGVVRLVLAYAMLSGLWVALSDWLVLGWVKDPARLTELGQIKGLAFVLISSVLLFGLAAEHQERIFRPFERLHGVSQYSGSGTGLAVVKRGVERKLPR